MKRNIWNKLCTTLGSLCLAAGILAIANVEPTWQEGRLSAHDSVAQVHTKKAVQPVLPPEVAANFKPLQSALSRSLEQDELKDENPFAQLSNMDPLQQIMRKGVSKFHRETYRSSDYKEETGYDLLAYDVEHTDGSHSTILAYLEKAGEQVMPFVVFMVANGSLSTYSFYRSGNLVEQSELNVAEAQTLITKRISSGVPFLSVSR